MGVKRPPDSALFGNAENRSHRLARQRFAELRMRVNEGRARHVQAHRFQKHLIAVRRAVEGAGSGAVIRGRFRLQQLLAADETLRVLLADLRLVSVRQPAAHRTGRHEDARKMAEVKRADQETRDDLVADAQQQRAVEHIVGEPDGGGHRDGVARKKAQLHAGQAWVTPSHIAGTPPATCTVAPSLRPRRESPPERSRTAGAPTACRCRP